MHRQPGGAGIGFNPWRDTSGPGRAVSGASVAHPPGATIRPVLVRIVHWLVFAAVVLHLLSCIVGGEARMPDVPF